MPVVVLSSFHVLLSCSSSYQFLSCLVLSCRRAPPHANSCLVSFCCLGLSSCSCACQLMYCLIVLCCRCGPLHAICCILLLYCVVVVPLRMTAVVLFCCIVLSSCSSVCHMSQDQPHALARSPLLFLSNLNCDQSFADLDAHPFGEVVGHSSRWRVARRLFLKKITMYLKCI